MVEVFKTSVKDRIHADMLVRLIHKTCRHHQANFDLEDCDNILRVECHNGHIDVNGILGIVKEFGFSAAILPDIPVSKSDIDSQTRRMTLR